MIRKIICQLCMVIAVTILGYTCLNYEMAIEEQKALEEEINERKYAVPDIELEKISDTQIKVRDKIVQYENVSDDTLKWYADQIEKCPDYLLSTVDEIHIVTRERLLELKPESKSTTIGFHKHYGTYSIVVLSEYKTTDRTVFLHEAIHAYDAQYEITDSPEFQSIYQAEGLEYDERAKNIKEYFAYSYTDYLTHDFNRSKYPQTTEFYKKLDQE